MPVISLILTSFILGGSPLASALMDSTTPGVLESYSTIYSIGFEWHISGDADHDATCTVEFRKNGTGAYQFAKDLYRVDFQNYNMLAGSILFLDPGTSYQVRLSLIDPDGGSTTQTATVNTQPLPQLPTGGTTFHVIPGNGGGDGSSNNPFQGVEAAETVAQPGDIFLLHAGNYGGTVFFNTAGSASNHVVWKGAGDGEAIFEGVRLEADYLWFENIKIVNQQYGMRTSEPGPKGVVVTRCQFENNHYSIYLNDGGEGWYIADNHIVGDNIPKTSNFSGEGIELWYTNGHTVAHNTISRVADGISYPGKNVDMFGNDIFDTSDDGIEFDYGHANNRAWKNRITNLFNNGISFQPMDGAPFYVLYNQVSVLNSQSVLKLRTRSDRAFIAHNTFVCNSGPMASGSNYLVNFEIKNNLWISVNDRYAWENGSNTPIGWKMDSDYNGFDWQGYVYAFKWGDRLDDIADFTALTGQDSHSIQINHQTCLDSLDFQEEAGATGNVDSFYLRYYLVKSSCNAKDAGIELPGINEDFIGTAPDLGAYEIGKPLPHYGVRTLCDQIITNKWVGPSNAYWHDDPSNWSMNRVPGSCDHVIIEQGTIVKIATGQTAVAYSLDVESGALLETEGAALLTIKVP